MIFMQENNNVKTWFGWCLSTKYTVREKEKNMVTLKNYKYNKMCLQYSSLMFFFYFSIKVCILTRWWPVLPLVLISYTSIITIFHAIPILENNHDIFFVETLYFWRVSNHLSSYLIIIIRTDLLWSVCV